LEGPRHPQTKSWIASCKIGNLDLLPKPFFGTNFYTNLNKFKFRFATVVRHCCPVSTPTSQSNSQDH
jgi:hypothetical protein